MKTKIEWTATYLEDGTVLPGYTFNPWWGCVKVSPACKFCYAETWDKRLGGNNWGVNSNRRKFGDKHWNEPLKWNTYAGQLGVRLKVFCASMADWAEDNDSIIYERERLFELIKATPNLNWLLLTKRMDKDILSKLPTDWSISNYSNVWLGTTCENQEEANKRLPFLLKIPATIHFVSAEPLLGPIDFTKIYIDGKFIDAFTSSFNYKLLDWVIVGGESGKLARPMHRDWVIEIARQTAKNDDVKFFFKQWGEWQDGSNVINQKYSGRHIVMLNNGDYAEWELNTELPFKNEICLLEKYKKEYRKINPIVLSMVGKHKSGRALQLDEFNSNVVFNQMPNL
jgi:protein gp37